MMPDSMLFNMRQTENSVSITNLGAHTRELNTYRFLFSAKVGTNVEIRGKLGHNGSTSAYNTNVNSTTYYNT